MLPGNDVAVYGNTDPSHGNFTAKIDNLPAVSLNGFAPALRPQTLMVSPFGPRSNDCCLEYTPALVLGQWAAIWEAHDYNN